MAKDASQLFCSGCGSTVDRLGRALSTCGRCKKVFYCGAECQKEHWKLHRLVCGKPVVAADTPRDDEAVETRTVQMSQELMNPCWGGPFNPNENFKDRFFRIRDTSLPLLSKRDHMEKTKKAKEFFRLSFLLSMMNELEVCLMSLTEGYLLKDTSTPKSQKFLREALRRTESFNEGVDGTRHTFLSMRLLESELQAEHGKISQQSFKDEEQVALWVKKRDAFVALGLKLLAGDIDCDPRLASRACLDLGRNKYSDTLPDRTLLLRAVQLWPDDVLARTWAGRQEDLMALVGSNGGLAEDALVEPTDRFFGRFCYELAYLLQNDDASSARQYFARGLRWEVLPGHGEALLGWPEVVEKKRHVAQILGIGSNPPDL